MISKSFCCAIFNEILSIALKLLEETKSQHINYTFDKTNIWIRCDQKKNQIGTVEKSVFTKIYNNYGVKHVITYAGTLLFPPIFSRDKDVYVVKHFWEQMNSFNRN